MKKLGHATRASATAMQGVSVASFISKPWEGLKMELNKLAIFLMGCCIGVYIGVIIMGLMRLASDKADELEKLFQPFDTKSGGENG